MEKFGIYIIVSLIALIGAVVGGGAILIQKGKILPGAKSKEKEEEEKEIVHLPIPKVSHLEAIMNAVYKMLGEDKTELDVTKYLEELNLEENIIKSITYEMKVKGNRMDELIKFAKKQFAQKKSVEEVRELLEEGGWAKNIIRLATEE